MGKYASEVVKQAQAWLGRKESDGTHKKIIDIYNNHKPLARGYKVKYTDEWCATFVSAVAIKLGYTSIIPTECSCNQMIELFKAKGCWVENENRTPKAGDIIFYDWQDNGVGDNKSSSDHVGIVEKVYGDVMYVIEGNKNEVVARRIVEINGRYIRGFGVPKYDKKPTSKPTNPKPTKSINTIAKEVLMGKWGDGEAREKALKKAGYNYDKVQEEVNRIYYSNKTTTKAPEVVNKVRNITATGKAKSFNKSVAGSLKTTDDLNLRNDAGVSHKILTTLPKGTEVKCFGYYTMLGKVRWYYIQVIIKGIKYTGFCHGGYLKRI